MVTDGPLATFSHCPYDTTGTSLCDWRLPTKATANKHHCAILLILLALCERSTWMLTSELKNHGYPVSGASPMTSLVMLRGGKSERFSIFVIIFFLWWKQHTSVPELSGASYQGLVLSNKPKMYVVSMVTSSCVLTCGSQWPNNVEHKQLHSDRSNALTSTACQSDIFRSSCLLFWQDSPPSHNLMNVLFFSTK